jgi:hypothetical protein
MIGVVLYCYTINDWQPRLLRQINRIHSSGLYDNADELHLVICDVENNKKELIESLIVGLPKIKLDYQTRNLAETPGLMKVDELCRNNDNCKVLYFHTKGVFNKFKDFGTMQVDELKVNGTNSWVEMMEFFLVDNWKKCVDKLDEYDTVGVTNNHNWWWGNFWWTKSSHVKKNVPIKDYYGGSRWSCEAWLHESNSEIHSIKPYEFYKFFFDAHYSTIPKYFYNGSNISDINIEIINAKFGYFSQQRDEGRGPQHDNDLFVDITEVVKDSIKIIDDEIYFFDYQKCDIEKLFVENFGHTFWCSLTKTLRIEFKTNIDPENQYVMNFINNNFKLKLVK